MFFTNLIQSNYGDLNIKSLAFDSFKERLCLTLTMMPQSQERQHLVLIHICRTMLNIE